MDCNFIRSYPDQAFLECWICIRSISDWIRFGSLKCYDSRTAKDQIWVYGSDSLLLLYKQKGEHKNV